jgi:hypothetical protein
MTGLTARRCIRVEAVVQGDSIRQFAWIETTEDTVICIELRPNLTADKGEVSGVNRAVQQLMDSREWAIGDDVTEWVLP